MVFSPATANMPLLVGLIVDSEHVSSYVADWVHWAKSQENVAITHLIIQDLPPCPRGRLERIHAAIDRHGLKAYL